MKKITKGSIIVTLVTCLVLMSVSTVFAESYAPTVTSSDSSVTFTSTLLQPWQLPGTEVIGQKYFPVGFGDQAQFSSQSIEVDGLKSGKSVQVCFAIPNYTSFWRGKIYTWDGTKWAATETITNPGSGESPHAYACTVKAGNGIYSLFLGYSD
jgi:hypothetical protein